MPNLSEEIRLKCEEVLGVPVLKVKWTDNPKVGLALTGEGTGAWIDLTTWQETQPVTIFQEVITVLKPKAKAEPSTEPAEELVKPAKAKRSPKPKASKPRASRKKKDSDTEL